MIQLEYDIFKISNDKQGFEFLLAVLHMINRNCRKHEISLQESRAY